MKNMIKNLLKPAGWFYKGHSTVLMYHRIVEDDIDTDGFQPNLPLCVSRSAFASQMAYLAQHYACIPSEEVTEKTGLLGRHRVAITFDDGYKDNLSIALPILEQYQIPFTIFVTTDFINHRTAPWWDLLEENLRQITSFDLALDDGKIIHFDCRSPNDKQATFDRLREMILSCPVDTYSSLCTRLFANLPQRTFDYARHFLTWGDITTLHRHPLATIGSHTLSHPPLRRCSEDLAGIEIEGSIHSLETMLESEIDAFAFPYGSANEAAQREHDIARALGCNTIFSTRQGHIHTAHRRTQHALPRIAITFNDSMRDFRIKLSGVEALICEQGKRVV